MIETQRLELASAKAQIEQLKEANKELKAKLTSLRGAKAPTTRVVKDPTKFVSINVASRLPQIVKEIPKEREDPRMAELQRKYHELRDEMAEFRRKYYQLEDRERNAQEQLLTVQQQLPAAQKRAEGAEGREKTLQEEVRRLQQLMKEREPSLKQAEEEFRRKVEQSHLAFMLELKASALQQIERLRDRAAEMQESYNRQSCSMAERWRLREEQFKQLWDARESEFQKLLEQLRTAKVSVTRQVTVLGRGAAAAELGEQLLGGGGTGARVAVESLKEHPEFSRHIQSTVEQWQGTPSKGLSFLR